MTYIIGFTGPDGVGKSTTAAKLCEVLQEMGLEADIFPIALQLKFLCAELIKGPAFPFFQEGLKDRPLGRNTSIEWAKEVTPRHVLITVANALRKELHPDVWLGITLANINNHVSIRNSYRRFVAIIDDVRYPNEVARCDLVVELTREGMEYSNHTPYQRLKPDVSFDIGAGFRPVLEYCIERINEYR